jgi:ABC-type transport system substrate-binding protein
MRGLSRARWIAGAGLMALAVTACGGGDPEPADSTPASNDGSDEPTSAAPQGGTLDYYAAEPAFLFPGMTNETSGAAVIQSLFSPLINYDTDTGDPYPVVAAELPTSDDNITWTIKINTGWTFHNGEDVTAQSFVDAWNWTAYGPNAANNGYFFGPGMADVVGYADVQSGEDPDGEEGPETAPAPAVDAMSGLEVVDDTTFTVTLAQPFSQFPLMLGYTAFFPVPSECIADWDPCNEHPIGNGPFMMDGDWQHDQGISVVRYEDYAGPDTPSIDGINFKIYADPATGYLDLQDGQLDYMSGVPATELVSAREIFGDRLVEQPTSTFTYVGFPLWNDQWGGTPEADYGGQAKRDLRHALSMAIDRQQIVDEIFSGSSVPADSYVSPVVQGYREGACGEYCTYDVAGAQALWESSGGVEGPINIWLNEGGDHELWMTAVGNYWEQAFGVSYELQTRVWADYLQARSEHALDGPFRLGWSMDYPSAQNYLAPIYGEGSGLPGFGYDSAEFNQLTSEGNAAATLEEGLAKYNEAEDILINDMPNIPMFFGQSRVAYNENVGGVIVDKFTNLDYSKVTLTE